ncbi:DUF1631 family protein [Aquincola sp. S2]|uniref:DUF1631 family protein n=1 Tax=Pseudaquabacterium terrae TaxID=2732868 RepID=A0ABX2ETZ9_9BURK|nr:DUF1631 family protein [Aquabacterium terrae]NRF71904.1 DUF1631 family protein [Aquabacterium terrae]
MQPNRRPTLQDFVDDEMLRAPLLFDQVVDAVLEMWRKSMGQGLRHGIDAPRVLQNHRGDLVAAAVRALRQQIAAHRGTAPPAPAPGGAPAAPAPAPKLELSLIDEDEVTVDIEISRAIERIKSMAEFELRELQAFTSALVGDFNVSKDTNPFRPEAYVRALWQGAQCLPMSRGGQAALLHDGADMLARTLRQGYAAACSRLEDQGVEPAVYRTIVVSPTTRGPVHHEAPPSSVPVSLQQIRHSLPAPLGEPTPSVHGALSAGPRIDQQLIDLLSRLFDAIQSDRLLSPPCMALLLRLHPTALRLAVQDASMLDDYDHAVWRFMDRLAFGIATAHTIELERWLAFARQLVDHLVADSAADVARFEWALERVTAYERHSFERALLVAQPEISSLQQTTDPAEQTLDIETMDTVPAELLPDEATISPASANQPIVLQLGEHLRAYLQGDWRLMQLLWFDRSGDTWLLRDAATPRHWALRLRAIERLAAAQLALPVRPRSLVRAAADRVLRSMPPITR